MTTGCDSDNAKVPGNSTPSPRLMLAAAGRTSKSKCLKKSLPRIGPSTTATRKLKVKECCFPVLSLKATVRFRSPPVAMREPLTVLALGPAAEAGPGRME